MLWRTWDIHLPKVVFVGLNPSKADETENDPTITRCINFAKSWGYGSLYMLNLFAYCTKSPSILKAQTDPIGPNNDDYLIRYANQADLVIAAWGNDGSYQGRSHELRAQIKSFHYIKMNLSGEPAHPLYLKADLKPILMPAV